MENTPNTAKLYNQSFKKPHNYIQNYNLIKALEIIASGYYTDEKGSCVKLTVGNCQRIAKTALSNNEYVVTYKLNNIQY